MTQEDQDLRCQDHDRVEPVLRRLETKTKTRGQQPWLVLCQDNIPINGRPSQYYLEMWFSAQRDGRQRDGRPAMTLAGGASAQRSKVLLTPTTRVPCSNADDAKSVEICRGAPN